MSLNLRKIVIIRVGTVNVIGKLIEESTKGIIIEYPLTFKILSNGDKESFVIDMYNPFVQNTRFSINPATIESMSELNEKVKENVSVVEYYNAQVDNLYERVKLELN